MSKFVNHRVDEKTRAAIGGMTALEKDQMYRALWFELVYEDLYQLCEDKHITDDDISRIAERYVYDCDYDCEIPYYDQLYALLDEVTLEKQSKKKNEPNDMKSVNLVDYADKLMTAVVNNEKLED